MRKLGFKKNMNPPANCIIEGCGKPHKARGYCSMHHKRLKVYGDPARRSFRDRNEIAVDGAVASIKLYEGLSDRVVATTVIDSEDVAKVSSYKWAYTPDGYARCNSAKISVQEAIMGQKWLDHIDGDKLNNRKSNLRPVSNMQNSWNRVGIEGSSSQYKGVFRDYMTRKPWKAGIKCDGTWITIGRFESEEEAAWMYDQFALELFGEFAKTNFRY